ncbi:MAG: desulfoferrodoxin family protein [Spirochaetales bacterium]
MTKMNFFLCNHCGNLIGMIHDAGVPVVCCGEKMHELVPGAVDAAQEKHVPVVAVNGTTVTVTVGEVAHPMEESHFIQWVYVQTEKGGQRKGLKPGDKPELTFAITEDDKVVCVYEYCNLHGLWVKEL